MPQIFKIGSYIVYFWANENEPIEPVHVHVAQGTPIANATKFWITKTGKCLLCNNNSRIPDRTLNVIRGVLEARSEDIIRRWSDFFGQIQYYC